MPQIKVCVRCKRKFEDSDGFVTCPRCRIYLSNHGQAGGCQRWGNAEEDPRVTRQDRIVKLKE